MSSETSTADPRTVGEKGDSEARSADLLGAGVSGGPRGGRRLIEEWLPIAALSEESVRERRSMTALPPVYYLHVWWARRPLVASRAAVLASLLPADADQKKFLHVLGIHGDPAASRARIDEAKRTGERFEGQAYSYDRAFKYKASPKEERWILAARGGEVPKVLDCTAGGGAIPFESLRLGNQTFANDLNPVAWLILKATVDFPARFGSPLHERYLELAAEFVKRRDARIRAFFPPEAKTNSEATNWLWARTIRCPHTGGCIPLSPNWKLDNKGSGVRYVPVEAGDDGYDTELARRLGAADGGPYMRFEMVEKASEQSAGTVKGGKATCPFPGDAFGRVIDGDYIKAEAQAGRMGEQLFAVVYTEQRPNGHYKNGKPKFKKHRGFRAPVPEDDVSDAVNAALAEKLPAWEAAGVVPDEAVPHGHKTGDDEGTGTDKPLKVGMSRWSDMFNPRQLIGHAVGVEVFQQLLSDAGKDITDCDRAALCYLALSLDKLRDYNSRMCRWHANRTVMVNTFDRHDFSFKWSYAEMAVAVTGLGYDWTTKQTGKALKELIDLAGHDGTPLLDAPDRAPVTVTCKSADDLDHLADHSVDAVVFDPPYYDNVMYAELSDFFYVWLKRTAGLLYPEPFSAYLTDKDREAVANPARFKQPVKVKGAESVKKRAGRDYQEKMAAIFAECRRVLKPEGVMTLMFTHKASGAWDALASGLVEAGFVITASWPVQTEAEGSMHIKDKNAAKSTIFLVCRPREEAAADAEPAWWEDVEPQVRGVVRERVESFQAAGIGGVDLYLACFGPALQVFSANWPIQRGTPKSKPLKAKGAQFKLAEDDAFDAYAVVPEDALMAARQAVKDWRFAQLAERTSTPHLDPVTDWYLLAWDCFKAASFPADEALKLARVVGANFDADLRNKVLEVKAGDVILWDSQRRAAEGVLGPASSSGGGGLTLDALHGAAQIARAQNLSAAQRLVEAAELKNRPEWKTGLTLALRVLPAPGAAATVKDGSPVAGATADAAALTDLHRLLYGEDLPPAKTTQKTAPLFGEEG